MKTKVFKNLRTVTSSLPRKKRSEGPFDVEVTELLKGILSHDEMPVVSLGFSGRGGGRWGVGIDAAIVGRASCYQIGVGPSHHPEGLVDLGTQRC